jgi:hypothetical protein
MTRRLLVGIASALLALAALHVPEPVVRAAPKAAVVAGAGDWPQLGHDAQRTNHTPLQVNPPFCYVWKWYEAPIAVRVQPVVVGNRLFIGSMDGGVYARDASTGGPLWRFQTGGPIRHSAGVLGDGVIASSHDGYTYALNSADGALLWKTDTGASATAPLIDETRGWIYVGATDGRLTALDGATGATKWVFDAGAPILTSPSLSVDGSRVFLGNERIEAIAVNAQTGVVVWRTRLQGQSLTDRFPVVAGDTVFYRSQPLYFFHTLLHEGDDVLDLGGAVHSDWAADWAAVRPHIVNYLASQPSKQTFFALDVATGASRGIAPVLYTTGENNPPDVPVVRNGEVFLAYRARKGIQTTGGSVHVSTKYDAEIGRMNPATLDIAGLQLAPGQRYSAQFRMTSDEPSAITMGGDILFVDNWERMGGINVATGQLVHVGNVSNVWPECYAGSTCGPDGSNPFFPMSGSGQAYPFPTPRVTEGSGRGGAVIANNMLYWRVIDGGLAGVKSGSCGPPRVWQSEPGADESLLDGSLADAATELAQAAGMLAPDVRATPASPIPAANQAVAPRALLPLVTRTKPLSSIVTTDLTEPAQNPPADLVARLRGEVQATLQLANGRHLMPLFLERGFSDTIVWPYNSSNCSGQAFCVARAMFVNHGNAFWQNPGELLLTFAQAYPYLDPPLQAQVKSYIAAEMERYPPLQSQGYNGSWLVEGVGREPYDVPFRSELNNWPPVGANISAIYSVWLWAKNTDDWTYACNTWPQAKALFDEERGAIRYYSEIAGLIGYARLAQALKARNCAGASEADFAAGVNAAVGALASGQGTPNFNAFAARAATDYIEPRDETSGWSVPVFFGMTPEIGQFLRESTGGAAMRYLNFRQSGDGLRWWYLTRVGKHAEAGESAYILPTAGWSHFLARAYVAGDSQADLRRYLDRPWAVGDPYSMQKIVATIHAR